jgi:nucleoid-associated protein YgaU
MKVQKDVLIAGGVVVVCVALVIVALVATGGKKGQPSEPQPPVDSFSQYPTASTDSFSAPLPPVSDPYSSASGSSSSLPPLSPSSSLGSLPSSTGSASGSGFDGGSALAPLPTDPAPLGTTGSAFEPTPVASTGAGDAFAPSASVSASSASASSSPAPASASHGGGTHTVAKGETLGDISAQHYGTAKHWRKIVEANAGLDPARLKIGQVIEIPVVEGSSSSSASTATVDGGNTHKIQKGESYYSIAKKELGSSSRWRELERLNGISAEDLRVGQVIKLPAKEHASAGGGAAASGGVGGGRTHVVSKGETLGDISKQYFGTTTKWKAIVEANPGVRPENLKVGQSLVIPEGVASVSTSGGSSAPAAGGNTYTVKSGDTLESIAASTLGKKSAWKQIVEANPGLKPTSLRVGQQLAIPGGSAPAADATGAPAPVGGIAPAGGAATPAPAPQPTFQDDPFYSPYDARPAAPASGAGADLGAGTGTAF